MQTNCHIGGIAAEDRYVSEQRFCIMQLECKLVLQVDDSWRNRAAAIGLSGKNRANIALFSNSSTIKKCFRP